MASAQLPSGGRPPLGFLFFFSFFLGLRSPIANAGPIRCEDAAGNYTTDGTFHANLRLLLASLTANTPAAGYFNDTEGGSPDQVFGHAMCRGDFSPAECGACVSRAAGDIVRYCANRKAGTAWYDDTCLVRYAGESFFGAPSGTQFFVFRRDNVSDPAAFNPLLGGLMDRLATSAAYRSPRRFAAGEANYTSFSKLYGLAQCTRDLEADACDHCLRGEISDIPGCCAGKMGGTVLGRSCQIRFSVGPFYNAIAAADPSPPAPQLGTNSTGNTTVSGNQQKEQPAAADKKTRSTIVLAVAIPVVVMLSSFCIIFAWFWRKKQKMRLRDGFGEDDIESKEFLVFDLETLKEATDNFSDTNKLGEGGFGPVYKGVLPDGQEIAVKRLSTDSRQGLAELRNEVFLVAKLHHRNLVKLLGCCLEHEKLLVYEFLPNKSLDGFLFDPEKCTQLDWETRYNIIQGIARGLQYLHEDSRLTIIHRDLKANNILLDEDLKPKISDFGVAKLFGNGESQWDTNTLAGTFGYMAPEYVRHGHISTKTDMFSFGVLLLEIVTGRRCTALHDFGNHSVDLISFARRHWAKGDVSHLVDQRLAVGWSMPEVEKCTHIGLLCTHNDLSLRPKMSEIVVMLSSQTITLAGASVPGATTTEEGNSAEDQELYPRDVQRPRRGARHTRLPSKNSMSMSTLEPR